MLQQFLSPIICLCLEVWHEVSQSAARVFSIGVIELWPTVQSVLTFFLTFAL